MTADDVRERVRGVLTDAARRESFDGTDIEPLTTAALAALAGPEVVAEVAEVLYLEGAYCGGCEYEGWDSCSQCREVCTGYALAVVERITGRAG